MFGWVTWMESAQFRRGPRVRDPGGLLSVAGVVDGCLV